MNVDMASIIELARLTTIGIGIVIGAFALVVSWRYSRASEATVKLMSAMVQSGSVIRMGTAVIIVLAIFGLRLTDKVSAEATSATLSGIAGYLLGSQTTPQLPPSA